MNNHLTFSRKNNFSLFLGSSIAFLGFFSFTCISILANLGILNFKISYASDGINNIYAIILNILWFSLLFLLYFCIKMIWVTYKYKIKKWKIIFFSCIPFILTYLVLFIPNYHFYFITMNVMIILNFIGCILTAFFLCLIFDV